MRDNEERIPTMKRSGILHAELAKALTSPRHTDLFAVSDPGLPVPDHVPVIDLGVSYGMPEFLPVLALVLDDVEVEAAWVSCDVVEANPRVHEALHAAVAPELIAHEEFKKRIADCRFVVRTGEATMFANVMLRAGVPWG